MLSPPSPPPVPPSRPRAAAALFAALAAAVPSQAPPAPPPVDFSSFCPPDTIDVGYNSSLEVRVVASSLVVGLHNPSYVEELMRLPRHQRPLLAADATQGGC